eukprot:12898931-Prorocentrum_lima.AAC.1
MGLELRSAPQERLLFGAALMSINWRDWHVMTPMQTSHLQLATHLDGIVYHVLAPGAMDAVKRRARGWWCEDE